MSIGTTRSPTSIISAATAAMQSGALPNLEQEVEFDVAAAIGANDLVKVYELAPRIAQLSSTQISVIKAKLRQHFGRDLSARDFDRAIRENRIRASRPLQPDGQPLPEIRCNNRPMRDVVADSLDALRTANDPPELFIRSGQMVYVGVDERQRPSIIAVTKAHLRGRLDRAANYLRCGENADVAVAPPVEVVEDILALPPKEWGLPALEVVVEVPTLRPDGTVLDVPGYDEQSRMLYIPAPGFAMDPLPDDPMTDDLDVAVALIDDAIGEFPYADDASRANVFGLLLTPIVRPAISGCTPLALVDAPQAGTGKSLLVDVFSIITTGRPAAMMPYPRTEEEIQKSIGSTLLAGRALVCFDNLEGVLSSPTVALVLTAKEYESRILGLSENMVVPNRATWVVTGNNIRPSGDMPRRCYHIRLDAKSSRPYTGRRFRHENLLAWVTENRPALLRALLLIARTWFQRGRPAAAADPLGSFEDWHRVTAGSLKVAGVDGFLANLDPFLAEADEMAVQWEHFLEELAAYWPDGVAFSAAQVCAQVRGATAMTPSPFTLPDSLGDVDRRKEGSLERAIGRSFAKRIGARFGERQIYLDRLPPGHNNVTRWTVLDRDIERHRLTPQTGGINSQDPR